MTAASIQHGAQGHHSRRLSEGQDMQVSSSSRLQYVSSAVKNLARSTDQQREARQWVADLLWVAFPSFSEAELAKKASPVLGISERQIRNYARCANDCPWRVVAILLAVAGAEVVFKKIEGTE